MRASIITLSILLALVVGGIKRFDHLATMPMSPDSFSWFNKAEIYTGYLAMMVEAQHTANRYPAYDHRNKH